VEKQRRYLLQKKTPESNSIVQLCGSVRLKAMAGLGLDMWFSISDSAPCDKMQQLTSRTAAITCTGALATVTSAEAVETSIKMDFRNRASVPQVVMFAELR
jgi:hypothetical protein